MKHLKMLGLAAMAAMALMALVGAGTASAKEGVLCSVSTDPCPLASKWPVGTVLDFSQEPGTTLKLLNTAGETLDTCTTATVKGELTANPAEPETTGAGTATGKITELTWGSPTTPCLYPTTTVTKGALKIEAEDAKGNGNVYADAKIEVTIQIPIFGSCIYGVEANTKIGTLSEGKKVAKTNEGAPTFTANAIAKRLNANFACPETAVWSGSYILTAPENTTLWVTKK